MEDPGAMEEAPLKMGITEGAGEADGAGRGISGVEC
jgi:hypothetical protein